jgi:hypothetical protein
MYDDDDEYGRESNDLKHNLNQVKLYFNYSIYDFVLIFLVAHYERSRAI